MALENDEVDGVERALRRRAVRHWVIGAAAVATTLGAGAMWIAARLRLIAEESASSAEGAPWPHQGVDLRAVHAHLLPDWYVAAGAAEPDAIALANARAQLWTALGPSPDLVARADALEAALAQPGAEGNAAEDLAVDAWNAQMQSIGAPFAIRLPLSPAIRAESPLVMGYEVLGGGDATIEGRALPWVLANRLDTIGVRESYHGVVEDGAPYAFVLTARIAEDALNRVWPLLATEPRGPLPDTLSPQVAIDAAWGPAVRAELETSLSADAFAQLDRLAAHRRALVDVQRTTDLRTERCGEGMALQVLPLRGWDPEEIDAWTRFVGPESGCTALFQREFDALRDASVALRSAAGLRSSAGELVAQLATPIVVHELRHVADAGAAPACVGCPEWLSDDQQIELSAYLDALRSAPLPTAQMHFLCIATVAGRRIAPIAEFLAQELLGGDCTTAVADLRDRAVALDARLYGPRAVITVTPPMPSTLPTRTVWGD